MEDRMAATFKPLQHRLARRQIMAGTASLIAAAPFDRSPARGNADNRLRHRVTSPDGRIEVLLTEPAATGQWPTWAAYCAGRTVLEESRLGLIRGDGTILGPGSSAIESRPSEQRGTWSPPYGIAKSYDGNYNELALALEDRRHRVRFSIIIAVHNDGFAVRYALPSRRDAINSLSGEATAFCLPEGTTIWCSRDEGEFAAFAPGEIAPVPHPDLTDSTDKGPLADTPLTAITRQGLTLSISESDRLHYPRMMFAPGETRNSIATHLMRFPGRATGYSGPGETHAAPIFSVRAPFQTPWRVVTVAESPAGLIEKAGLIPTLASSNRLGDSSWIRPGRAFRIRTPYTTQRAIDCIDFASMRSLEFVEFDAHWYGDGTDASDATVPIADIDLPRIIAYARDRGIGVILYVDRVPAMRQLDAIVKTYQQWGVAGIKFGFVWEGRQEDVDLIYDMVRKCGEHRLMVNLHDNLRPAGLERTLPNYIALEGVRGNEQFPTARHNVTLPFTRALSGPIDYTICYDHYKNQTTNAHQMAMAAVYYNPLTFLYWYDEPYKYTAGKWPDLEFLDRCPTTWDETRALSGAIGEHVVVARRHGAGWFLGAMTNEEARTLEIPMSFLREGSWTATIFADGATGEKAWQTKVAITRRQIRASDTLQLKLAPSGGQAIIFETISED